MDALSTQDDLSEYTAPIHSSESRKIKESEQCKQNGEKLKLEDQKQN
jgi:hypothetical protein